MRTGVNRSMRGRPAWAIHTLPKSQPNASRPRAPPRRSTSSP